MTSELKPCPFCGSKAIEGPKYPQVWCSDCKADGPIAPTREQTYAHWNRRAPSEAVGLLREVVALWDADSFDIPIGDLDKTVDKIRRFLAAQEGT